MRFLGFYAGNTRVVTVTAVWFSSPFFQFTIGMFSISVFSSFVFALLVVFGLLGKLFATGCRCWFLGVFFGGFFTVFWVCLGFLLPPALFVGCRSFFGVEFKVVGSDCCV